MLTAIVVEDEIAILNLMKITINKNKNINVIAGYTHPTEALDNIIKLKPSVVFLDVELPGITGIELAKKIHSLEENIKIIFSTAYSEYAVDAFRVNAVDYILKPITEDEVNRVVNKLLKKVYPNNYSDTSYKYKISCLGKFEVSAVNSTTIVRWPTTKTEELFAYFIVNIGISINKWKLCEILWPDRDEKRAEHNLYNTIYRMKSTLNKYDIPITILNEKGCYKLDFKDYSCDAAAFEKFAAQNEEINANNVKKFDKFFSLYEGHLFEEKDYVWSIMSSENLSELYLKLTKKLAYFYFENAQYLNAEVVLKKTIDIYPLDEQMHELLIKLYHFMGNRTRVISHYENLRKILKSELNIKPNNAITQIYLQSL